MPPMPTDLPENDRALVVAAKAGHEWRPMGEKKPTPDELADPDFVAGMKGVQASTIRALYLGLWDDVVVDPKGVYVRGARIDGTLNLLFGAGRGALSLQHCHFTEQVVARDARLPALWLDASHLAKGLFGVGMRIEGDLSCREGFRSQGEVRLLSAQIGGNAAFRGARLSGAKDKNGVTGAALSADRIVVEGSLFCDVGFRSQGEVRLLGAQIGSDVDFGGAELDGDGGAALQADGMEVKGGFYCRADGGKAFRIDGDASLVGARVGRLMDWRPQEWNGELNLSHTVVGQWCDAWGVTEKAGPGTSSIILDHFSYGAFLGWEEMKADSGTRIAWIQASQGEKFAPGPYQTLARVLRAAGDDRGAAAVGLAKARARVKHHAKEYGWPRRWLYRLWMCVLDEAVGHGYRPWKGAGWLAYMLILGMIIFGLNAPEPYGGPGTIKPADPVFIAQNHIKKPGEYALSEKADKILERGHAFPYALPVEYTPFSAFWYSFDTLVPLIDLGQEKAWSPSPLAPEITKDPAGWALLFYLYLHIIAGWVLTTLTVVALTGLIKRDKEEE